MKEYIVYGFQYSRHRETHYKNTMKIFRGFIINKTSIDKNMALSLIT